MLPVSAHLLVAADEAREGSLDAMKIAEALKVTIDELAQSRLKVVPKVHVET